ncbi:MAG: hypothetical protein ACYS0G_09325 [Planctomycetota bacterium]|jgi:hypothetical protein
MFTTLACDDAFAELITSVEFIPVLAITLGCLTGMIGIAGWAISSVVRTRAREQTKRELAAYVAEGTLDPDKAVAIANAGMRKWEVPGLDKCCGNNA